MLPVDNLSDCPTLTERAIGLSSLADTAIGFDGDEEDYKEDEEDPASRDAVVDILAARSLILWVGACIPSAPYPRS